MTLNLMSLIRRIYRASSFVSIMFIAVHLTDYLTVLPDVYRDAVMRYL